MIGKLKGVVDSIGEDWVILDVGGVGYQVNCSARTLAHLPPIGEAIALAIETYLRQDQIKLFGFANDNEREWFRLLMTVQGVGAKVALAVLSIVSASELASAIALRDIGVVTRAPGVGKRVAERICGELKDKAPAYTLVDPAVAGSQAGLEQNIAPAPLADAVSALVNLGYAQVQASTAVAAAAREAGDSATAETLIRLSLKELAR